MPAKLGDDLIAGRDLHIVDPGAAAARNFARTRNQHVAELARLDEGDVALRRDRLLVMAVAGKGEGGIGECEDEAAMGDALAVHHVRLHGHGQRRAARPDLDDLHAEPGGRIVLLPHRVRAGARQILGR